jgi:hypothetical protein
MEHLPCVLKRRMCKELFMPVTVSAFYIDQCTSSQKVQNPPYVMHFLIEVGERTTQHSVSSKGIHMS